MFRTNNRCVDMDMGGQMGFPMGVQMEQPVLPGMECEPVMECPCERVVNRQICHHVPHIQPIHTRIVNHHVYNHSYMPQFTCCEENIVSHVHEQNPCCR